MKYVIDSFNTNGTVTVTFSDGPIAVPQGRATHDIAGLSLDNKEALEAQLEEYGRSFFEGLQREQEQATGPQVANDVLAMKNKTQTIAEPEA